MIWSDSGLILFRLHPTPTTTEYLMLDVLNRGARGEQICLVACAYGVALSVPPIHKMDPFMSLLITEFGWVQWFQIASRCNQIEHFLSALSMLAG